MSYMQWHSNNRDNDRTMLLQKLATKATLFQVLGKKKTQCLTPLKDYHFIEMKVGLKAYLRHGVSCMDDRIYPEHRRHTRVIANIIPDSESVHDE